MNSATLALDFKSATLYAVRVVLHNADLAQLTAALDKRMADAGSFFENEPVVIDASRVETPVDWAALVTALRGHKLPPIGVVAEGDNLRAALAAGLAAVELSTPPPRAPQQADAGGAPPPMPTQPAADLVAAPEPTATPAEAETAAKVISGTGTAAAGAAPVSSAADGNAEVAKEDAAKTNGAGTGAGGKNGGNGGANAGQRNGKPAEGAGARNGNGGNAAGLPAAPARQPIPERAARSTTSAAAPTATDPQSSSALVITRPLRSGQRVYARHSDLVVIGMVSQGAEVIADGNVHVYGPLRGKAMAGARGDTTARIFTTHLDAELLAVAGVYRVIEDKLDATLHGKPALVRLEGDTLRLEALKS